MNNQESHGSGKISTSSSVDYLVSKMVNSEKYLCFKAILHLKNSNENKAKNILVSNMGRLTHEHIAEVLKLIDEPYPYEYQGKSNHLPWFGKLIRMNGINILDETEERINQWFQLLSNDRIPVERRIDQLRQGPLKINGLAIGFITLMLYILDKGNYLIWFGPQHDGIIKIYPELGDFKPNGTNYIRFNNMAKEFANRYHFEHTELDWIFSVGL